MVMVDDDADSGGGLEATVDLCDCRDSCSTCAGCIATVCDQESFNLLLLPNRSFLCRSFLQELKELILPNSVGPEGAKHEMFAGFVYDQ